MMKKTIAALAASALGLLLLSVASATHVVEVSIDSASIDGDGNLVVSGTVTCNDGSVNSVSIQSISASQSNGTTSGGVTLDPNGGTPCTAGGNTYPWTATIAPSGGDWDWKLDATVTATSECCGDADQSNPVSETADVNVANPGGQQGGPGNNNGQGSNAGAGNGGDGAPTEEGDADPGKSGGKNNAPPTPPGQAA